VITYFGLTTADNRVIQPSGTDEAGRPIFLRPTGAGFFIVVEAKPGTSNSAPDTRNLANINDPTTWPDVQILASRPLGNGSTEVCDKGPPPLPIGGVPGFPSLLFDPSSDAVARALNDFGCRLSENTLFPCTLDALERPAFVRSDSTVQVCTDTVIGNEMRFPSGNTILAVQWRDRAGNVGRPAYIVVRVP
jgi:hypothetical protein